MTERTMDTTGFKSAKELDMTNEERAALIETMLQLECGEIEHYNHGHFGKNKNGFYMPNWVRRRRVHNNSACGTIACIGGWIATKLQLGGDRRDYVRIVGEIMNRNLELNRMFSGYGGNNCNMDDLTPAMAANVIREFLQTGRTRWDKHT